MIVTCKTCGAVGEAHKQRRKHCVPCGKAIVVDGTRRYRERHPDRNADSRRRYVAANKDLERLRYAKYCTDNREKCLARYRAYHQINAAKGLAYNKRRREEQPERVRFFDREHRLRYDTKIKAGKRQRRYAFAIAVRTLTPEQWSATLELFGHACAYCLRTDRKLTLDHVIALSRGGHHSDDNVVPACARCNCTKKERPVWVMAGRTL